MSELSSTRRILVADDDPERLQALIGRLQREGFDVLSAQDGLEALDRAREELPDAIILNLLLRRIDGLRVCEILKSNPATTNIPVLLMAGVHVDADEGKRALAAGADRFLTDLGPLSTGSGRELGSDQDLVQAVRGLLGAEPEQEVRPSCSPSTTIPTTGRSSPRRSQNRASTSSRHQTRPRRAGSSMAAAPP